MLRSYKHWLHCARTRQVDIFNHQPPLTPSRPFIIPHPCTPLKSLSSALCFVSISEQGRKEGKATEEEGFGPVNTQCVPRLAPHPLPPSPFFPPSPYVPLPANLLSPCPIFPPLVCITITLFFLLPLRFLQDIHTDMSHETIL